MDKIDLKEFYLLYHSPFGNQRNTHPRNKLKGKIGITKRYPKRLREQGLELGYNCEVVAFVSQKLGAELAGRIEGLIAEHYRYEKGNPL